MSRPSSQTDGESLAGAERRGAARVAVDLDVDYQCEDTYLFAAVTDISATGIFVRTVAPLPTGTRLNLRFARPVAPPATPRPEPASAERAAAANSNHDFAHALASCEPQWPLAIVGEVMWTNPLREHGTSDPGMGIRFVEVNESTQLRLLDLIRRMAYLPM